MVVVVHLGLDEVVALRVRALAGPAHRGVPNVVQRLEAEVAKHRAQLRESVDIRESRREDKHNDHQHEDQRSAAREARVRGTRHLHLGGLEAVGAGIAGNLSVRIGKKHARTGAVDLVRRQHFVHVVGLAVHVANDADEAHLALEVGPRALAVPLLHRVLELLAVEAFRRLLPPRKLRLLPQQTPVHRRAAHVPSASGWGPGLEVGARRVRRPETFAGRLLQGREVHVEHHAGVASARAVHEQFRGGRGGVGDDVFDHNAVLAHVEVVPRHSLVPGEDHLLAPLRRLRHHDQVPVRRDLVDVDALVGLDPRAPAVARQIRVHLVLLVRQVLAHVARGHDQAQPVRRRVHGRVVVVVADPVEVQEAAPGFAARVRVPERIHLGGLQVVPDRALGERDDGASEGRLAPALRLGVPAIHLRLVRVLLVVVVRRLVQVVCLLVLQVPVVVGGVRVALVGDVNALQRLHLVELAIAVAVAEVICKGERVSDPGLVGNVNMPDAGVIRARFFAVVDLDHHAALGRVENRVTLLAQLDRESRRFKLSPAVGGNLKRHRLRLHVLHLGDEDISVGDQKFIAVLHRCVQGTALVVCIDKVDACVPQRQALLVAALLTEMRKINSVLHLVRLVPPRELDNVRGHQLERVAAVLRQVQHVLAHPVVAVRAVAGVRPRREQTPQRTRRVEDKGVNHVLVLQDTPVAACVVRHKMHQLVRRNQNRRIVVRIRHHAVHTRGIR